MGELTPGVALSPPVPLITEHDIGQFDCGVPTLDDWLTRRARASESRNARTYVLCSEQRVVAYYCLAAGMIERSAAPGRLRRNAPDALPVAVIGRLAVDRLWSGQGLGAALLADALRRSAMAARTIGIAAVMVQAKDEVAKAFYLRCAGFAEYPADSRTLFLPIEKVLTGFS